MCASELKIINRHGRHQGILVCRCAKIKLPTNTIALCGELAERVSQTIYAQANCFDSLDAVCQPNLPLTDTPLGDLLRIVFRKGL